MSLSGIRECPAPSQRDFEAQAESCPEEGKEVRAEDGHGSSAGAQNLMAVVTQCDPICSAHSRLWLCIVPLLSETYGAQQ